MFKDAQRCSRSLRDKQAVPLTDNLPLRDCADTIKTLVGHRNANFAGTGTDLHTVTSIYKGVANHNQGESAIPSEYSVDRFGGQCNMIFHNVDPISKSVFGGRCDGCSSICIFLLMGILAEVVQISIFFVLLFTSSASFITISTQLFEQLGVPYLG